MTTDRQLVVAGVDGSQESLAALRWAAGYATATGARLRAVLAWQYPATYGAPKVGAPEAITEEVRQHMTDDLGQAVGQAAPGLEVEQSLGYGHPAEVLVAESQEADLLVVGRRGHGQFTGMLLGSVSMHCVTHAHCPVVVVKAEAD
jgi:nucleotide-binding universal stress UspA family protein